MAGFFYSQRLVLFVFVLFNSVRCPCNVFSVTLISTLLLTYLLTYLLTIGQYASSPGHKAYCYAELAVSSLAVAGATASTHSCLPTEGWLRMSRPGCLVLCRGGLPVQRRSLIQALTGPGVD